MVFTGGNRSHGALVVVGDRRYRLKGLKEGEVALLRRPGPDRFILPATAHCDERAER